MQKSLFARKVTAQPISKLIFKFSFVVLLSYMIFNMFIGFYFVLLPIVKRSANDLTNLIHQNIKTWSASSAENKRALSQQLLLSQNILFSMELNQLAANKSTSYLPYIYFLKKNLNQKLDTNLSIDYFPGQQHQYVISINYPKPLYIYFDQSRIGTSPPLVIISILLSSILISILASYFLAHRLDNYFQPLIKASIKLSKGESPEPVEINGPSEIQLLSKSFNNMSNDVHQLLENRTTLLAGVSHNLRTPVARIKLALELLPENTDPELRNKIDRSLNEIDSTIGQFLKMAEGMNTLSPQNASLSLIIKNIIDEINTEGSNTEIKINFSPTTETLCNISVTAIQQILLNLIENSLRYANGSDIEIRIEKCAKQIHIKVIDQGPGIPAEIQHRVFQAFVTHPTRHSEQSNVAGGTGLGLAICQIIAKAHKWELTLDSDSSNGTCACLSIPVDIYEYF